MIEVKNLSKSYGEIEVFKNTNLFIEENRIYGLFARNGVGKSTLLKILSDQIINYDGHVNYKGKSIKDNKDFKKRVILISEDFIPDALKTEKLKDILDIIKSFLTTFNQKRFDELTKIFNMNMKNKYYKLSFGNQSIFRNMIGLASGVEFIFYDEPTTGLDEINRDTFYKKLMEYQDMDESTVIISSHNVADIEKIISDVIILKDKKVIVNDSIYDIEEKSYAITIDPKYLGLLAKKNILTKKAFAGELVVNVFDEFTDSELNELNEKSRVNRLELRDLFIAINKEQ